MTYHGTTVHPRHASALRKAMDQCDQARGATGMRRRAAEIATLSTKDWKGKPVYRLVCQADFGKGPHEMWVPEYLLWMLIDLRHYRCVYH